MAPNELIVKVRTEKGLSQRKLASLANISPTVLCRFEQGHLANIGADALARVAAVLALDPEELLCSSGKLPPEIFKLLQCNSKLVRLLTDVVEQYGVNATLEDFQFSVCKSGRPA